MSDYMDRTLGLGLGAKGSSLILLGLLVALAARLAQFSDALI